MSHKKEINSESSSLSTFSQSSDHTEVTKKAISTEQISIQNVQTILQRQNYLSQFVLPFQTNIKDLIKHFEIKFQEMGAIVLYCDANDGQILVKQSPNHECLHRFLDCLCIFRREGFPRKNIQNTFETISVTIKRQNIQRKCVLKIRGNLPRSKGSKQLQQFAGIINEKARQIILNFKVRDESIGQKENIQIRGDSPLGMQVMAMKKIYHVFIKGSKQLKDERPKTLFNTSVLKIKQQIKTFDENKKNKLHFLIEKVIEETNSLFSVLAYSQEFRRFELHRDFILYSIENLFCHHYLLDIFNIYKKSMEKNCEQFRKNSQYINKKISNKEYFDYLEVRQRYRLPQQQHPYAIAIHSLRELQACVSLRQYLLCVQKTFSSLKVCCLQEHKGKVQISSMDDILPVMIYICAKAQVQDFPVYVKMVDDYIRIRDTFQLQERIVTTLYVAVQDICKKVPQQKKV